MDYRRGVSGFMRPKSRNSATVGIGLIVACAVCAAAILSLMCGSALASSLPDGRAWEMVSPTDKNGGEINGIDGVVPTEGLPEGGIIESSEDGDSITYLSLLAFPGSNGAEPAGAPIASQYLSRRASDGWSTEDLTTPVSSGAYPPVGNGAPYKAFSSDLSMGLMLNGSPPPVESPTIPGAPSRYVNYYLRENESGKFLGALLTSPPAEGPSEFFIELLGVTPDLRHIVLDTRAALGPVTTRQPEGNIYEWSNGRFQPLNVEPGTSSTSQTVSGEAQLGMGFDESHTISSDGSRVFWDQSGANSLFVRKNIGTPQAETVQMDATRIGVPQEPREGSGHGEFKTASFNGSRAFFTDKQRLTTDSTASGFREAQDLYMFNVENGQLTDLTVDGNDSAGAAVQGVVEANGDGSYVYFVAKGHLPGTTAATGNDNLYVWHEAATGERTIRFIAALSPNDNGHGGYYEPGVAHDWDSSVASRTARVTADGQRLVFMSDEPLTGYDNRDAKTGLPDEEVFMYNAVVGHPVCLSCNPSGAQPIGPSGIPGGTPWRTVPERGTYQSRVLSTDGSRVFFDSDDALVPQDTNGAWDVYEWEEGDSGGCRIEAGCISLLSGATSTSDSSFVDASATGDDVFFITRAQLVSQDPDQLRDLYDARVGGGFPVHVSSGPPCEGEGCLPTPQLPLRSARQRVRHLAAWAIFLQPHPCLP